MERYYNYLDSIGITDGPSAGLVVSQKDPIEALEVLSRCFQEVNLATHDKTENADSELFTFSASSSTSGGVEPCSGVECRLREAYRLSLFTALYGNSVTIPNFFDYFYDIAESNEFPFKNDYEINNFYNRLIGDIAVYFEYKPLIDVGLINVNHTLIAICSECQKRLIENDKKVRVEIEKIASHLKKEVLNQVKFLLHPDHYVEFIDSKNYLPIEGIRVNKLYGIKTAKTKRLMHKGEVKRLGIDAFIVTMSVNDILIQNYYPDLSSKTYLTNRPLDIDVIEASKLIEQTVSPLTPKDFEHVVPCVSEVEVEKVLAVRNSESQAFQSYRDSLQTVMDAARDDSSISVAEAINDEVIPAVHKIEQVISSRKKFFREKAAREVLFGTSLVTAGVLASHFFATEVGRKAAEVGGADVAAGVKNLITANITPEEARNNRFYFLWKTARAHRH